MANLGCLFVCTFGDYLAPVLIAARTYNNVNFGGEQNEGHEIEVQIHSTLVVDHKIWPSHGSKCMNKKWLTGLKMYLGISSIGPSVPWRACWNMFITPKKDMMRPAVRGHNQGCN